MVFHTYHCVSLPRKFIRTAIEACIKASLLQRTLNFKNTLMNTDTESSSLLAHLKTTITTTYLKLYTEKSKIPDSNCHQSYTEHFVKSNSKSTFWYRYVIFEESMSWGLLHTRNLKCFFHHSFSTHWKSRKLIMKMKGVSRKTYHTETFFQTTPSCNTDETIK